MEIQSRGFTDLESLDTCYGKMLQDLRFSGCIPEELYLLYNKENLKDIYLWYNALATVEYALERQSDTKLLVNFVRQLFYENDCNASVHLNKENYAWFWHKIHQILDQIALFDPWALMEKGIQYFSARREYKDPALTLKYLEEASVRDEYFSILLGYYLYLGLCDKTDKVRGLELIKNVTKEENSFWSYLYQAYVAITEQDIDRARTFSALVALNPRGERQIRVNLELQAILAELDQDVEKAVACFDQVLEICNSGLAYFRLGYMHLTEQLEKVDPQKGFQLIETAYCFGRYDAANTLAYFYNPQNEYSYQDFQKYLFWLEKGYLYGEPYCAYELSSVYLLNEEYKDISQGMEYLDYAISKGYEDALLRKAFFYHEGNLLERDDNKMVELLEQAVKNGSGYAAYRLGTLYENGELGSEPDYQTAFYWYKEAALLGHVFGYDLAGRYYRYGYAVEPDNETAKQCFEKAISLGSAYSAVELAFMYEEGIEVEKDLTQAYALYKQAAAGEYPFAMLRLGIYEEDGLVGEINLSAAFDWYRQGAELGQAEAMFRLARCYRYALGTEEAPDLAIEWLQKGVKEGEMHCLTELALCYEAQYGVEEDPGKVVEYMSAAAEKGYGYAQYKMGTYYMNGYGMIEEEHAKAVEWLEKAIANEIPYAMIDMGDYYLYDYDNQQQYDKAFSYYKQALEYDCITEGLGYCFYFGYGTEVNEPEAFKYFLMAAERGYIQAMYRTGLAYYFGWGIKLNKEEAFRWFREAAQNDSCAAQFYVGKMLLEGDGCIAHIEEGINWLCKAAEAGDADAQFEMGNCYLLGRGVNENQDRALEWFERAAENGHEQAQKVVGKRKRRR